jgi:hypothetical protein
MKDTIIKNKPAHIDGGLERSRFQSKLVGGKTKKNKKPMRKTMKKKNGGNQAKSALKGVLNKLGMRTKSQYELLKTIKEYKNHTLNMLSDENDTLNKTEQKQKLNEKYQKLNEKYINWWTCKFRNKFGDTYTGKDKCTAFSFLSQSRQINIIYQENKKAFIDFQKEHDITAKKYLDKLPTSEKEDKADIKINRSLKQPGTIDTAKEGLIISTQYELSDVVLNDEYTDDFIGKLQTICVNNDLKKNIKETCNYYKSLEENLKKEEKVIA